ncbi:hypothetical protein MRX96_002810 [Rhipicephalus microplus]
MKRRRKRVNPGREGKKLWRDANRSRIEIGACRSVHRSRRGGCPRVRTLRGRPTTVVHLMQLHSTCRYRCPVSLSPLVRFEIETPHNDKLTQEQGDALRILRFHDHGVMGIGSGGVRPAAA